MNDQDDDKMNEKPGHEENDTDDDLKDQFQMPIESRDGYGIPLELISDDGSIFTSRPIFTVAIDSATRTVVGMHIQIDVQDAEQS